METFTKDEGKSEMIMTSIKLDKDLMDNLKEVAQADQRTMKSIIVLALKAYLPEKRAELGLTA